MPSEWLNHYYRSPIWRATRQVFLIRANWTCQDCGEYRPGGLDVHHRPEVGAYERLGFERPSDCVVLCRNCHDRRHGHGIAAVAA